MAGTKAQNIDDGLFVGAETFHGFMESLGVVFGVERGRGMDSRIIRLMAMKQRN